MKPQDVTRTKPQLGLDDKALLGALNSDELIGDRTNNKRRGGAGHDFIKGGAGKDSLEGCVGNDTMHGGMGNDSIMGGLGFDYLFGDHGQDFLDGGEGDDTLDGGFGQDRLMGGLGNDVLMGGQGNDTLVGSAGASLDNSSEFDMLTGGRQRDTFVLGAASDGTNPAMAFYTNGGDADYVIITDFTRMDRLQLAGTATDYVVQDFSGTTPAGMAIAGAGIYHTSTATDGTTSLDLVAVLQGVATTNVNLTAPTMQYLA